MDVKWQEGEQTSPGRASRIGPVRAGFSLASTQKLCFSPRGLAAFRPRENSVQLTFLLITTDKPRMKSKGTGFVAESDTWSLCICQAVVFSQTSHRACSRSPGLRDAVTHASVFILSYKQETACKTRTRNRKRLCFLERHALPVYWSWQRRQNTESFKRVQEVSVGKGGQCKRVPSFSKTG